MPCRKYVLTYIGRDDDDLDLNNKQIKWVTNLVYNHVRKCVNNT